jgi:hypothetical protein
MEKEIIPLRHEAPGNEDVLDVEVKVHAFLTLVLYGGNLSGLLDAPADLLPGAYWTRG